MITNIEINRLFPHSGNPRKDLGDLAELAESIKANGILQNLTVVPRGDGEDYTVVIGHRRIAAAQMAGLTEVPCTIADMDEHMQIATMLTENIQRNDLTPYEQAQGFQMMLDLGDSVGEISRRTGISDTTIRKRVKWLELDEEKFAASIERGATFADYEALNKIKDIKARNKVLQEIGTENFAWALKSAISSETRAENKAALLSILKGFATKIKSNETSKYQYIKYVSLDNREIDIPDDADAEKYYYTEDNYGLTLYKERQQQEQEKPKKSAEEIAHEGKLKQLKVLFKQAYELRVAFAKSFVATGKKVNPIDKMAIELLFASSTRLDTDVFRAVFGIKEKFRMSWENADKGETYEEALKRVIAENEKTANATMIFLGIYCRLEDDDHNCQTWGSSLCYKRNAKLEALYGFLTAIGYVMSDEEKALLEGRHELYEAADPDEDDDDNDDGYYDDEDDEDAEESDADCELCKSAHPSCDNCCAECEDECNAAQACRKNTEADQ